MKFKELLHLKIIIHLHHKHSRRWLVSRGSERSDTFQITNRLLKLTSHHSEALDSIISSGALNDSHFGPTFTENQKAAGCKKEYLC